MPSTYTPRLRLTLPATGENSGTWGALVNAGITDLLDAAIAGYASVAMTDADYTLTAVNGAADQARQMMLNMTGTLTAARNVICPTASKMYVIKNSTTGGFAITLKTASGTGVLIPNGGSMLLMCDGTNVVEVVTAATFLGIGMTPTYRLDVQSGAAASAARFASTGTSVLARFADGTAETGYIGSGTGLLSGLARTDYGIAANTGNALVLGSNNTERMRINSAGNVGIGQPSPQTSLGFANNATISWGTTNYPYVSGDQVANTLIFGTQATERMRINSAGNVGIGTNNPLTKLDVSSSGDTTLRVNKLGVADVYLTAGANGIYGIDSAYTVLSFGVNNVERARITDAGDLISTVPTTPPTLSTNGQMVMNLTSNTNLRISVRGTDGVTRVANLTLA